MQKQSNSAPEELIRAVQRMSNMVVILLLLLLILTLAWLLKTPVVTKQLTSAGPKADKNGLFTEAARKALEEKLKDTVQYWQAPDTANWAQEQHVSEIRYGRNIISNTAYYFGSNGSVGKNYSNGMNCQNCHLEAGTKIWGNNYSAVMSTYPKYRARSGQIETVTKRINDCFERSLNGKSLDTASREMKAIVAYIQWLGRDVVKGEKPAGSGFHELAYLDRAASVDLGKKVYQSKCQTCHGNDGQGQQNPETNLYTYPPLWGPHSYNSAAGLYRLSNFARYVKYNMPQGVDYQHTQLTDEEAWDVAAFVNSQPRPGFDTKNDWPKLEEKPIDYPFGPFADGFDEILHKYGPFQAIVEKRISARKKTF